MQTSGEVAPSAAPVQAAQGWGRTDALMLLAITIWGINFTAVKIALASLSPLAFNALRFSGTALLMLAILAAQAGRARDWSLMRVRRRDWLPLIILGLIGHGIYHALFALGMARTTPANSSLLLATMPIWVAILGSFTGVERINRVMWAGILLSFAGITTLVSGGGKVEMGSSTLVGDVMLLGCSILWAVYTTGSKPYLGRYSPVALTTWTMVAASVPLVAIGVPELRQTDWSAVPALAWAGLVYSVVLSVGVGYIIWSTSVQRVGNARTAVYSNLTPIVAILFAWVALGDALSPLQLAGGGIVLAGLMLTRKGRSSSSVERGATELDGVER